MVEDIAIGQVESGGQGNRTQLWVRQKVEDRQIGYLAESEG